VLLQKCQFTIVDYVQNAVLPPADFLAEQVQRLLDVFETVEHAHRQKHRLQVFMYVCLARKELETGLRSVTVAIQLVLTTDRQNQLSLLHVAWADIWVQFEIVLLGKKQQLVQVETESVAFLVEHIEQNECVGLAVFIVVLYRVGLVQERVTVLGLQGRLRASVVELTQSETQVFHLDLP